MRGSVGHLPPLGGDVYDVRLSDGSQLGVTARHPVWSVDRGKWVSLKLQGTCESNTDSRRSE